MTTLTATARATLHAAWPRPGPGGPGTTSPMAAGTATCAADPARSPSTRVRSELARHAWRLRSRIPGGADPRTDGQKVALTSPAPSGRLAPHLAQELLHSLHPPVDQVRLTELVSANPTDERSKSADCDRLSRVLPRLGRLPALSIHHGGLLRLRRHSSRRGANIDGTRFGKTCTVYIDVRVARDAGWARRSLSSPTREAESLRRPEMSW